MSSANSPTTASRSSSPPNEVSFARDVADWVIFLAQGRVQESRPATDFFTAPQTDLAREYLHGLARYR